jgi:ABC-2 type transport system permease protein
MLANITRLDLRLRRRSTIWYAAGMALYALVVVVLYPSFKHQTSLNSLSGSTAAALFGITGPLTSPGGSLNANIYSNFFPLIMLLLTIGYGAAALAGQDEDGTLALLTALPIRRRAILLQKAAAMAVQALLLAVAVAICVVIGRGFQLSINPANTIAVSAALLLMGLDFGLVTMAVGAVTGRRGTALGVGTGLAAASYLVSSLASTISAIRPGRYFSLFTGRSATTRSAEGRAWPTSRS